MAHLRTAVALLSSALFLSCGTPSARMPVDKMSEHWQRLATDDLLASHKAMEDAHPGAIDPENPGFRDWLEAGAEQAASYVPRIRSYEDMVAVLRFYTAGFHDGHVFYEDTRPAAEVVVNGWHVASQGDGHTAVVDQLAPNWPVPLPPMGSKLVACDGRAAQRLLAEDIAPFIGVEASGQRALMDGYTFPPLGDMRWKSCRFITPEGRAIELPQLWQRVPAQVFGQLLYGGQRSRQPGKNSFERLPDGTLWIRAGNFQPSKEDNLALERMLQMLHDGPAVHRVVFDARGNGGSSSWLGERIFTAATGGLDFGNFASNKFPVTSAWWRVSDIAIATVSSHVRKSLERGEDDSILQYFRWLGQTMTNARAQGQAWVLQPGGAPRITRADTVALHARLRRPIEQVALLTDENCASACLDFADLVRSVPGALHLGRTTGADTVYLEAGKHPLPSGNLLILPLKVWRNRVRGNNEALVPDVPLSFDQDSEEATRHVVLGILNRHRADH